MSLLNIYNIATDYNNPHLKRVGNSINIEKGAEDAQSIATS